VHNVEDKLDSTCFAVCFLCLLRRPTLITDMITLIRDK